MFTDIQDAWRFNVKRSFLDNRPPVPDKALIERHINFRKNFLEKLKEYPNLKPVAYVKKNGEKLENAVVHNQDRAKGPLEYKSATKREEMLNELQTTLYTKSDAEQDILIGKQELWSENPDFYTKALGEPNEINIRQDVKKSERANYRGRQQRVAEDTRQLEATAPSAKVESQAQSQAKQLPAIVLQYLS